jgi:hypothetical protein
MEFRFEVGGKFFCGEGAGANIARKVQGQADNDGGAAMTADEAGEGAEVIAAVGAIEGEQGLGGEAQLV